MKYLFPLYLLIILLSLSSCIEPIDLDVERQGGQLFVDGEITNSTRPHVLNLRRSAVNPRITSPETGALITIFDDQGNAEVLIEQEEGQYYHYGNVVKGEKGRSYHLEIQLPDGSTYRSRPVRIPTYQAQQTIYYDTFYEEELNDNNFVVGNWKVRIFNNVSFPPNEEPIYLRWQMYEVYRITQFIPFPIPFYRTCYPRVYSNTENFVLYDGSEIQLSQINDQFINSRTFDFSFNERHYFNVIQSTLNPEAFTYWQQINQLVNSTGSIFDVPPAAIPGNLYNINDETEEVLGYFEASARDTARLFLLPGDVPEVIDHLDCDCNCDHLRYSTRERPYYF